MAKQAIADFVHFLGISRLGFSLANRPGAVRAVNYHDIWDFANFRRQLQFYSKHFRLIGEKELLAFFKGRKLSSPAMVLTFDDGRPSHYKAAKILQGMGIAGWFFVPTAEVGKKDRLTWQQIKEMSRHHAIGGHTRTHLRLSGRNSTTRLTGEIAGCRTDLEKHLGTAKSFAWVGGELESYSRAAAEIVNSEFELVFQTCSWPIKQGASPKHLHRTNIESTDSSSLVFLQLSGLLDIAYIPKRLAVEWITR